MLEAALTGALAGCSYALPGVAMFFALAPPRLWFDDGLPGLIRYGSGRDFVELIMAVLVAVLWPVAFLAFGGFLAYRVVHAVVFGGLDTVRAIGGRTRQELAARRELKGGYARGAVSLAELLK